MHTRIIAAIIWPILWQQWAVDHCQEIDNSTDEMKLKYTELYNQFVEAYESKMSAFLESQGSTVNEFLEELKAVNLFHTPERDPLK